MIFKNIDLGVGSDDNCYLIFIKMHGIDVAGHCYSRRRIVISALLNFNY